MREAGVNLVTVGVFAWACLEPQPGDYHFDWLDRVIDLLYAHGVAVDLATATASPPPWLSARHPESLPILVDGARLWPGGRQHYCPHSVEYRSAALSLVGQLAHRYASHPGLALWHVNNEYGGMPACYCDVSAAAFRNWLQQRYGQLDALNDAWGTSFWSQAYADWEEINPPRRTPAFANPSQQLDFYRFSSESFLDLFRAERDLLATITPEIPVTTNFMGFFKPVDYWSFAAEEDVISNDIYPRPEDPNEPLRSAMIHDLVRSLAGGGPWMLMEQTPSRVNWRGRNVAKAPGQQRLWSYQALARGADGILFFQWRASVFGAEKFHGAMLPHSGVRTSSWREIVQMGNELSELSEIVGSRVEPSVAILFSWENWWALELTSKPADIELLDQVLAYYRPLWAAGLVAEFRPPGRTCPDERWFACRTYILSTIQQRQRLFGTFGRAVWLSYHSSAASSTLTTTYAVVRTQLRGRSFSAPTCSTFIRIPKASAARFEHRRTRSLPVIFGRRRLKCTGPKWLPRTTKVALRASRRYCATNTEWARSSTSGRAFIEKGMAWLLSRALTRAGMVPPDHFPAGVEGVRRVARDVRFLFLLNHSNAHVEVELDVPGLNLLSGVRGTNVMLAPRDVAIVRENRVESWVANG